MSGDTPVKPPGGNPSKEDLDISKAKVNYTYESRFRGKPVELNIICIHEAVSGRHIPESGYRVSYLNNDRPGEATAVITGQSGYTGEQRINYKITGIYIVQAPKENDILTEYRTVVAMIEGVIGLAKKLGVKTVVEGVENAAQLSFLNCSGCNLLQGDYLSEPLPEYLFLDLLEKQETPEKTV